MNRMDANKVMSVGIIGAGHIAEKAARTLNAMYSAECLAIASRSQAKADEFAGRFGIPRAYCGYDALLDDPDIDLVYVALPHTLHFDVTKRALLRGKPCLVESAEEAREILALSQRSGVLVAEAMWPRYMPVRAMAEEIIASGAIGRVLSVNATLGYNVADKERIMRLDLGGGALLDLGVYCLNFIRMYGGGEIVSMSSHCTKLPTGPDAAETVTLELSGGVLATACVSAVSQCENIGVVAGETGYLLFDDVINPTKLQICRKRHIVEKEYKVPAQITGFEYEFEACREALVSGGGVPQMPHSEIQLIMDLMDSLLHEWGI